MKNTTTTNVKDLSKLNTTMDDAKLKALKKEILESLSRDRHNLICALPFFGNLAMRFDIVPVRDVRVGTACTNGRKIFVDCDFYLGLTPEERGFIILHELSHIMLLHFARLQTRDRELFNYATDMEVNYMISTSTNGASIASPKNVLYPPHDLEGKSAEVIYEWLISQQKKNAKQNGKNIAASFGSQGNNTDNDRGDDDDSNDNSGSGSSSSKPSKSGKPGNNSKSKLTGQFDGHEYSDSVGDAENGSRWPCDQWGEKGIDGDFDCNGVEPGTAERVREAVVSSAQQTARAHGTIPASIETLLNKLAKPEISWKELLAQFVTKCYAGHRTWNPPSRRHLYNDMYFQSRRGDKINIAVAIDTSGSTINDRPKFIGELKSLVESFGNYTIHMIHCDAAVDHYEMYDDNNPLDIDDAGKEYPVYGGGGTSFNPPFEYVADNNLEVDCMIYFTDGYAPCPDFKPNYPVLWLVTKDGSTDFCPWGEMVRFKESGYDY